MIIMRKDFVKLFIKVILSELNSRIDPPLINNLYDNKAIIKYRTQQDALFY